MTDQIVDLVTKLRSLSPKRQAELTAEFKKIATAVAKFDTADEEGSRSVGFSFSLSHSSGGGGVFLPTNLEPLND